MMCKEFAEQQQIAAGFGSIPRNKSREILPEYTEGDSGDYGALLCWHAIYGILVFQHCSRFHWHRRRSRGGHGELPSTADATL